MLSDLMNTCSSLDKSDALSSALLIIHLKTPRILHWNLGFSVGHSDNFTELIWNNLIKLIIHSTIPITSSTLQSHLISGFWWLAISVSQHRSQMCSPCTGKWRIEDRASGVILQLSLIGWHERRSHGFYDSSRRVSPLEELFTKKASHELHPLNHQFVHLCDCEISDWFDFKTCFGEFVLKFLNLISKICGVDS